MPDRNPTTSRALSWTPGLRARFIESLALCGDVRGAASVCGLSRQSAYRLRQRDAGFAAAWENALAHFGAALERETRAELARLIEYRLLRRERNAADARFFDLLAEMLGKDKLAALGVGSFSPGPRQHHQPVSTDHFTQSSPICS